MIKTRPELPSKSRYGIMEVCSILQISYNTARRYIAIHRLKEDVDEFLNKSYTAKAIIDCYDGKNWLMQEMSQARKSRRL